MERGQAPQKLGEKSMKEIGSKNYFYKKYKSY
jgi:hypothetical protein